MLRNSNIVHYDDYIPRGIQFHGTKSHKTKEARDCDRPFNGDSCASAVAHMVGQKADHAAAQKRH